ncbi:hypothetical protein Dimus_013746, partial [Dionaea muscipula]
MYQIFQKLKFVKQALRKLHSGYVSSLNDRIKIATAGLTEAQLRLRDEMSDENRLVVNGFTYHLKFLLRVED